MIKDRDCRHETSQRITPEQRPAEQRGYGDPQHDRGRRRAKQTADYLTSLRIYGQRTTHRERPKHRGPLP